MYSLKPLSCTWRLRSLFYLKLYTLSMLWHNISSTNHSSKLFEGSVLFVCDVVSKIFCCGGLFLFVNWYDDLDLKFPFVFCMIGFHNRFVNSTNPNLPKKKKEKDCQFHPRNDGLSWLKIQMELSSYLAKKKC